jgi:hypothetical protein
VAVGTADCVTHLQVKESSNRRVVCLDKLEPLLPSPGQVALPQRGLRDEESLVVQFLKDNRQKLMSVVLFRTSELGNLLINNCFKHFHLSKTEFPGRRRLLKIFQ